MLRTLILTGFLCLSLNAFIFAHGDIHEQIERTSQRIEKDPNNTELYLKRGQLYIHHNEFEKAKDDYLKARELDADLIIVDLLLAIVYSKDDQAEIALDYANIFLTNQPDNPDGLIARAGIFQQLENKIAAKADLEKALDNINTPAPKHYLAITEVILQADNPNYEEALSWLEKGQTQFGFDIVLKEKEIEILVENEQYETALHIIDDITERFPRKEKWFFLKGEICEKSNQKEAALTYYNATLEAIQVLPKRIQKTKRVLSLKTMTMERIQSLSR